MSSSFPNSAGFGFNPVSSIAAATSSITTDNALGQGSGVGRDFSTQTHYEPAVHDSRPPTIHELCQAGDIPALERLWAEGNCDVNERDGTDVTPLHWAAINAQIGTCQWLLDHGAEVDAVGGELRATPLQWAARNGHLYVLHLLLKNSADPNIRDCQGFNTLHLVTHSSVVMALLYILQQPIAVDERDSDGHTALMWASWQGDAISVDLLLRHGASVAAMDNAQLTPLHWASVKGSRACVKRLLDAGADVWAQEENGKTAKDMAKELKALEPYRLALEDHGWDVNGRPKERLLSPKHIQYAILAGPTIFLFLIFSTFSSFPIYTSIPLSLALFFGMHHFLTRFLLGSKGFGDTVTGSPYYVAIITGSFIWVAYCWIMYLLPGTLGRPFLQLAFAIAFTMCGYNFYKAIRTDPGYIRRLENDDELKELIEDLTASGNLNGTVFCINCMNRKPLRAKHCRLCNRCTGRFDHHCPWIWNCVGFNNHPQFLLFVGSMVAAIIFFDMLVGTYVSENVEPVGTPEPTSYPSICNVTPTLCAASTAFPFLLAVTFWASLQLIWTMILLVTQVMQVCRQMTTLEVSNLGRFGFMGGRGGSSLRDQNGAVSKLMASRSVGTGQASGQLSVVGAGPGQSGADEIGEIEVDNVEGDAEGVGMLPVTQAGLASQQAFGGGQGPGHSHRHGGQHHHRFGIIGRFCTTALNMCTNGPMLQLLGLDRFTKGRAIQGLRQSGGGSNPFNIGIVGNCEDFWTRGDALGVDYRELYEIPHEGFASKRVNSRGMARSLRMTASSMVSSRDRSEYQLVSDQIGEDIGPSHVEANNTGPSHATADNLGSDHVGGIVIDPGHALVNIQSSPETIPSEHSFPEPVQISDPTPPVEKISLPTPDYRDLPDSVYEPAEDTFILLDALEKDALELMALKPALVVEIGPGSGVVSSFLARLLQGEGQRPTALSLAVDLNPEACVTTKATGKLNDVSLDVVRSDLLSGLRLTGNKPIVDVLVFNPPYVPTDELEMEQTQMDGGIGATWAGGASGMNVTDRVLEGLPDIIAPNGRFYLVAVSQNDPQGIITRLSAHGFDGSILLKRRAGREMLHVVRLIKR